MATEGEEVEYESDPEEAMLPLALRRREASDDEESDEEAREKRPVARGLIGSDGESDGQGGAQVYEDEESETEEVEEGEEEDVQEEDDGGVGVAEFYEKGGEGGEAPFAASEMALATESGEESATGARGNNQEEEEEKKENEPFAVPTAGAFYMHDDRFQDNGSARHRRTSGGRKLWESKDNRAWVHDRFEEMNLQDVRYDEERRRNGKGRFRGRGRYRGADRGYARGNRSRNFDDVNGQNRNNKGFRGRGPRRYEPPAKNHREMPAMLDKQSGKSFDTTSNANSGRVPTQTSNAQSDLVHPRKHVFASSLNSASPPFYPSGSSSQEISLTQKRDTLTGSTNRNFQSSVLSKESLSPSHSTTLMRGKTIVEHNSPEGSFTDDSIRLVSGKPFNNAQLQSSGSSMPLDTRQSAQTRSQGKGISGQLNYQSTSSLNQVNRGPAQTQIPAVHHRSVQSPVVPPASRGSPHQLIQHPGSGTQVSLTQASSTNSSEAGEMESPPGSSKAKTALSGKDKDSIQVSGKGSYLYGAPQVIGAAGPMGLAHGDQNFSATPALLPVMQFGGQHPGGLGVPAVGMALPGYVAQSQLGFGNSEMTWVPFLAGAAGALGASYCSPFFAADGGIYPRSSGQTSSSGGSKETTTNKPNNTLKPAQRPELVNNEFGQRQNTLKPAQRPELVNDEFGQRQNKPRRYSEMNFGQ